MIGLPKISLNILYAGVHWTKRKRIKDKYYWLIKSQFKSVFPKTGKYTVFYEFFFKSNPLDASNCMAAIKMIEDVIFEDDKWDIVTQITISSQKSKENLIKITVTQIN